MASKIKQFFSDFGDKVKTSMKIDNAAPFYYLSLLFLFILAVLVRMSPAANGVFLIKAFDAWYQFDSFKQLTEMGLYEWLRFHDNQFWFPQGVDRFALRPGLLIASALCYWFLTALGIPVTHLEVAFYFPAFMGGLTVVLMYFLGKEVLDKRAGLLSAFFLAFSPGHMQRTVVGFFDNETVGVFAVLFTFLFFIRAVKYGKLSNGILAGLGLGFLSLSWGGLTYVYGLLPLIVAILILMDRYNSRVFLAYVSTIGVGLLIYSINPTFRWNKMITDFNVLIPFAFLCVLTVYQLIYSQKGTTFYDNSIKLIKWGAVPVALALVLFIWQWPELLPFNLGARLMSILNPALREAVSLVASVGEHAPSPWSTFYYNSLIPILFLIPGIYFALRRGNAEDILMIVFLLSLFYFTGSMIRIVLLFAPAAALMGGYALSNIFKALDRILEKQPKFQRRRRRQVKRVMGSSEGIIVYCVFGLLLFAQANHAVNISSTSLPYADLVAAGQFHDWEESLTWMNENLPGSAVVASWWDYGYWLTTIGNVTTVNDNGTWNQTRIGLTGMAMMETEEANSVQIFEQLKAEYVLVYFGHLITGIGGDEGKWPWMVRICNDNTDKYEQMSKIPKDNWYGYYDSDVQTVDTVFDEEDYINSTNGAYRDAWFDSTLVKLMFDGEVETINAGDINTAPPTLQNLYVSLYGGNNNDPVKDDYGQEWTTRDVINDEYDLKYFDPVYISENHLVKLYKIDYSATETDFTVSNTYLDNEGNGFAEISNTGETDIEVSDVSVVQLATSAETLVNFTVEDSADPVIKSGESRYIWFDATDLTLIENNNYNIEVTAVMGDYSLSKTSVNSKIIAPENVEIIIDRGSSSIDIDGNIADIVLNVVNPSDSPTLINAVGIDGTIIDVSDVTESNEMIVLSPGSTEEIVFEDIAIDSGDDFTKAVDLSLYTVLSEPINTIFGKSKSGFNLNINPSLYTQLPDQSIQFNYSTYTQYDGPNNDYYLPFDETSYLLDNGTMYLKIENTGDDVFSLQNILCDEQVVDISSFNVVPDHTIAPGYEMIIDPADYRIITGVLPDVELNTPKEIIVTAMNEEVVAADAVYMVPRSVGKSLTIISDENSITSLFANETIRIQIKNTGSDDLSLTEVEINGTESITLNDSMILYGDDLTIAPTEVITCLVPFEQFKINQTNDLSIVVKADTVSSNTVVLTGRVPSLDAVFGLVLDEDDYAHNEDVGCYALPSEIHLMFNVTDEESVVIDGISLQTSDDVCHYLSLDSSSFTLYDNEPEEDRTEITDLTITGAVPTEDLENPDTALYYADITDIGAYNLVTDDVIVIKVISVRGYEALIELTVG